MQREAGEGMACIQDSGLGANFRQEDWRARAWAMGWRGWAGPKPGPGVLYTPDSLDTLQLQPGRSIMVSFQLGFGPKGR